MRMFKLPFALLLLSPSIGSAGSVSSTALVLDEGNTSALLEATSQRYVDAMQRILQARWRGEYTARRWEALEAIMAETPVARLEYRVSDSAPLRLYHGMGGPPLGSMAEEAFQGPTPSSSPTPFDDFDDAPPEPHATSAMRAKYGAQDAADADMYAADDGLHVRARLRSLDGSVLHPYPIDGTDRAFDAEFKVLGELEHDLRAGIVPRGGKASLLISAETCSSCGYAFDAIANRYGIDIHVTRVASSIAPSDRSRLIAEGTARMRGIRLVDKASGRPLLATDILASAREAQVRQSLAPAAMNRRFRHVTWEPRAFRLGTPEEAGVTGDGNVSTPAPGC